ncbi:MAG TPA: NAD-dependent epimerase/dehydratase family protein [Solirubrobacteraceae bacterium]|nr:NAD-dependent epimerase/dehydratase family protein [Solirubrobacteraceae bacterium]
MSGDGRGKVLVTGASGLIGRHVVQALLNAGYDTRGLVRGAAPEHRGDVEYVRGDVRDPASLDRAMDGCAAVVHTAAVYSYDRADADLMASTNIEGTANVLDAAARTRADRVVLTSSSATCGPVAGRPADEHDSPPRWELTVPYKRSKIAAERLALARAARGQDVVIVNPTTTVGRHDHRPTPSGCMVRDVVAGRIRGYITTSGLNIVSVQDVAHGHVLALERGRSGERYLLGGENLSMQAAFTLIAQRAGVCAPRIGIPYPVARVTAEVLHVASWAPIMREPSLMVLDEVRLARLPMYFSVDRARRQLGYTHQPADEALAPAVDWFAERLLSRASARPARRGAPGRRAVTP